MSESGMDFVGEGQVSSRVAGPALHVEPATGDVYLVGQRITDPSTLAKLAKHVPIHDGETAIWLPSDSKPSLLKALTIEEERGRQEYDEPTFGTLLESSERSAIHLEARDTYDATDPAFQKWLVDGDTSFEWDDWIEFIGRAVKRGVRMRRLRIVSEPVSDYIRWEHAISYGNIAAGEDLRWLPRHLAYDLPIPIADYWMFDQRLIRYHYTSGAGAEMNKFEYVTDPRKIISAVGMFEMAWERAIPHADYVPS